MWDPDIGEHTSIDDIVNAYKVFAAMMVDIRSKTREDLGLSTLASAARACSLPHA